MHQFPHPLLRLNGILFLTMVTDLVLGCKNASQVSLSGISRRFQTPSKCIEHPLLSRENLAGTLLLKCLRRKGTAPVRQVRYFLVASSCNMSMGRSPSLTLPMAPRAPEKVSVF